MRKIIIANWKMNPSSLKEAEKIFKDIAKKISGKRGSDVVVCPPFVYTKSLKKISSKIILGAQDLFFGEIGAFTGEVSGQMLYDVSARYVIVGHSERRKLGEKNIDINKKIKSALSASLVPVLCVGEELRDEKHEYFNIVKNQIIECLDGIQKNDIVNIIIAYEPVWAISTTENRKDATAQDAYEMNIFIKKVLSDKFGSKIEMPRILYGGSVNERDALFFLKDGGVDGLLVGGASLNADKFSRIVDSASL